MIFINTNHSGYAPEQCGKTLTVGELISILEDFEEDCPVYLRHDNGYTYSSIIECDISTQEELENNE